jgi:hypothetical protein
MRVTFPKHKRCRLESGHSLPEVIFAVCLVGMMLVSLYTGFSSGFTIVRSARQNIRATEILTRQSERLRLLNWTQVLDTQNFLRPTFTETLDPNDSPSNPTSLTYFGTIEPSTPTDWPAAYRNQVRLITITLTWTNTIGSTPIVNQRQMQTCIARYGMQSYIAGP